MERVAGGTGDGGAILVPLEGEVHPQGDDGEIEGVLIERVDDFRRLGHNNRTGRATACGRYARAAGSRRRPMIDHHFAIAVVLDADHASAVRTGLDVYADDEIDACSRPIGIGVGSDPTDFMAVFQVVDRHFAASI